MTIIPGRFTARTDKPVVLFLIGMRINNFLALGDILFMAKTMPAMLRELSEKKDSGMLWYRQHLSPPYISVQQYWESFDKLLAYAHDDISGAQSSLVGAATLFHRTDQNPIATFDPKKFTQLRREILYHHSASH